MTFPVLFLNPMEQSSYQLLLMWSDINFKCFDQEKQAWFFSSPFILRVLFRLRPFLEKHTTLKLPLKCAVLNWAYCISTVSHNALHSNCLFRSPMWLFKAGVFTITFLAYYNHKLSWKCKIIMMRSFDNNVATNTISFAIYKSRYIVSK